jgi:hypothetical protein
LDTEEGVEGRDLIKWRRVEKWDKRSRLREVLVLFWLSLLLVSIRSLDDLV